MGNIPKVSEYFDMDTASTNKVGFVELTHRQNTNQIADILNGTWANWTPTVAYTGTTVPLQSRVAKYIQIGSTVFFDFMQTGPGNTGVSVSAMNISLPIEPKTGTARYIPLPGVEYHGATYQDPMAYIDTIDTGPTGLTGAANAIHMLKFRNFLTITTSAYRIEISGRYEVG